MAFAQGPDVLGPGPEPHGEAGHLPYVQGIVEM